jgi:hypothetical protein
MTEAERCLIIPDIHQDIAWAQRILQRELPNTDHVVFLGDYFDTSLIQTRAGKEETCAFLLQTQQSLGSKITFLLGNHDIQYLEARPWSEAYRKPRNLLYKCGSSFSTSGSKKIAKALPRSFWGAAKLFIPINGFLLTHAGLSSKLWPQKASISESLSVLEAQCAEAQFEMQRGPHPLLSAGKVRGGESPVGGITWLDWEFEFSDDLPLPQIVGHTSNIQGARQKGRSWCIDGKQSTYATLTRNQLDICSA